MPVGREPLSHRGMTDTATSITDITPAYEKSVDAALESIVKDDPEPEVSALDEPSAPVLQDAPDEEQTQESDIDEDALAEAYEAFRRDRLSEEEIGARLERLGHKKFVSTGQKRAKKHRADDEAHSYLRRLRQEQEGKGTTDAEKRGSKPQAGAPTLNLAEVAAPVAERLALDDEGKKTLVAALEAVAQSKNAEIMTLGERLSLVSSVLTDILQEGVMKDVGLDHLDEDDRYRLQESYQELVHTSRHGELPPKQRMAALLKDAARLNGFEAKGAEEIQRKASIAKAKSNGAPVVARQRPLPKGQMSHREQVDHMADLITRGAFKTGEDAAAYSERLRKRK